MVGFPDLSDTDESAINEIISQAQDACVLEQVSAINCSGFTHSALPTDLESRFRKLKSFPVSKSKQNPKTLDDSVKGKSVSNSLSDAQTLQCSPSMENQMDYDNKLRSGSSDSSDISKDEKGEFTPLKKNSWGKREVKAKSKTGSVLSPSKSGSLSSPRSSSNSLKDHSPSPPRKTGCFWCSPKKDSKKKSKENWGSANFLGWDNSVELLSDLGSFSSKHQQKMLKKAIKEEQKISREAEKIVQWAKQATSRTSVVGIEDDLSDE